MSSFQIGESGHVFIVEYPLYHKHAHTDRVILRERENEGELKKQLLLALINSVQPPIRHENVPI